MRISLDLYLVTLYSCATVRLHRGRARYARAPPLTLEAI